MKGKDRRSERLHEGFILLLAGVFLIGLLAATFILGLWIVRGEV